jgi:hypothetical protein
MPGDSCDGASKAGSDLMRGYLNDFNKRGTLALPSDEAYQLLNAYKYYKNPAPGKCMAELSEGDLAGEIAGLRDDIGGDYWKEILAKFGNQPFVELVKNAVVTEDGQIHSSDLQHGLDSIPEPTLPTEPASAPPAEEPPPHSDRPLPPRKELPPFLPDPTREKLKI